MLDLPLRGKHFRLYDARKCIFLSLIWERTLEVMQIEKVLAANSQQSGNLIQSVKMYFII